MKRSILLFLALLSCTAVSAQVAVRPNEYEVGVGLNMAKQAGVDEVVTGGIHFEWRRNFSTLPLDAGIYSALLVGSEGGLRVGAVGDANLMRGRNVSLFAGAKFGGIMGFWLPEDRDGCTIFPGEFGLGYEAGLRVGVEFFRHVRFTLSKGYVTGRDYHNYPYGFSLGIVFGGGKLNREQERLQSHTIRVRE